MQAEPSLKSKCYFQMCFAPQQRALFPHLNFQKWSENGVLCTCLLPNVLRATAACTFSTSQLPKVVRDRRVLALVTSKCASRHNGLHFFHISTSKSAPRPRCFDTFYFQILLRVTTSCNFHVSSAQMSPHPPLWRAYFSTLRSHKTLERHSVSRLPYLFAHLHLLSSDFLISDLLHLLSSPF